jgi:hypothetical protein
MEQTTGICQCRSNSRRGRTQSALQTRQAGRTAFIGPCKSRVNTVQNGGESHAFSEPKGVFKDCWTNSVGHWSRVSRFPTIAGSIVNSNLLGSDLWANKITSLPRGAKPNPAVFGMLDRKGSRPTLLWGRTLSAMRKNRFAHCVRFAFPQCLK